jgi:acetyltransferase-like isoleucine patch superfamily enzyme
VKKNIEKIIKRNAWLNLNITIVRKLGLKRWLINVIFQRVLRRHSKLDFNVNFTSNISEKNISFNRDLTTLLSFAASGSCYFQAINGIKLGQNCLFAPSVKLISANHDFTSLDKSVKSLPIVIGDNCWLGVNTVILPGVRLGDDCIVGAGSVVTKSFEECGCVIAGNPAKLIKKWK